MVYPYVHGHQFSPIGFITLKPNDNFGSSRLALSFAFASDDELNTSVYIHVNKNERPTKGNCPPFIWRSFFPCIMTGDT